MHAGGLVILELCLYRQFVMTAPRISINTEARNGSNRNIRELRRIYLVSLCSDAALDNSSNAPSTSPDAIIKREFAFELRLCSMIPLRSDLRTRIFWTNSARRVASG
jgi:hypothetical protein